MYNCVLYISHCKRNHSCKESPAFSQTMCWENRPPQLMLITDYTQSHFAAGSTGSRVRLGIELWSLTGRQSPVSRSLAPRWFQFLELNVKRYKIIMMTLAVHYFCAFLDFSMIRDEASRGESSRVEVRAVGTFVGRFLYYCARTACGTETQTQLPIDPQTPCNHIESGFHSWRPSTNSSWNVWTTHNRFRCPTRHNSTRLDSLRPQR